ncbi:MAG: hypothetical protein JW876_07005 [Candidatus Krumholzibacteriota bacterium]|nr:hypothetical protein [Candidatus Krumholzibacteriota bacterium]
MSFTLPAAARTILRVYDARGARVRTLLDGRRTAGPQAVVWDGTNDRGEPVPSGVYLVSLCAGEAAASHKLALVR